MTKAVKFVLLIALLLFKNKTCILFESFGILFLKNNGGD